jgi:putative acetyltransferase
MCTARTQRGRGYASEVLQHIIGVARERGYRQLYLETGSTPPFEPAHALYRKAGFTFCDPFADYKEDPFSRFMVLPL